jgi:hypothetical protein
VIRPWAAEFAALLGEQATYLVHAPEVAVAEALQPVADLRFELEVVQPPYLVAHGWSEYPPVPTLSSRRRAYVPPGDRASSPGGMKNITPVASSG